MIVDEFGHPVVSTAQLNEIGGWGGWGGNRALFPSSSPSEARGYTPRFNLDAGTLSRATRLQQVRLSQYLVENFGPAGCIRTLAGLVGHLRPRANTRDTKFNDAVKERFGDIAETAIQVDARGLETFYTWQIMATYHAMRDGSFFSLFTNTEYGTRQLAGGEAFQIGEPTNTKGRQEQGWVDGIKLDKDTRSALAYQFLKTDGTNDGGPVDASLVHHHAFRRSRTSIHGLPLLDSGTLISFADVMEVASFQKTGMKAANLFAVVEQATTGAQAPSMGGFGAPIYNQPREIGAPQVPGNPATTQAQKMEDVFGPVVAKTQPGRRLEVLNDSRPHPNGEAFKAMLLRLAAISIGLPPDLLFFLENPGGVEIRMNLELAARWIANQQINLLLPFVRKALPMFLAPEIKAGRLPKPRDFGWWRPNRWKWTPQVGLTVDLGRMGKMMTDLRKHAMLSLAKFYTENGLEWDEELSQISLELKFARELEQRDGHREGMLTDLVLGVSQRRNEELDGDPQQKKPAETKPKK